MVKRFMQNMFVLKRARTSIVDRVKKNLTERNAFKNLE